LSEHKAAQAGRPAADPCGPSWQYRCVAATSY
jgi:hypothetical protein